MRVGQALSTVIRTGKYAIMRTITRLSDLFMQAIQVILIAVIVGLSAAILFTTIEALGFLDLGIVSELSALSGAGEVLQFLGIGIAGTVLMLQALIANRRAKAMEDAAAAQAGAAGAHATANLNAEKGQRQERLKNAIEHLGSSSESVRLGGAYELFHLAEDTASLRQTALDILCAHIRRTTREDWYKEEYTSKPSGEIESLLAQLFVYGHKVFSGHRVNLSESWLNGADLSRARLPRADLRSAHLDKAILEDAQLEGTNLLEAHLNGARLGHACLRDASLVFVQMAGAYLEYAELQGANILGGHLAGTVLRYGSLQGANLMSAQLYGVDLRSASLEGARLSWVSLEGATLDGANLRGAGDPDWNLSFPYAERIRAAVGNESNMTQVYIGGLTRERVDQIVDELEDPSRREVLSQQLQPYIDAPVRHGLTESYGVILGHYGQEEAAGWIAEHESAMRADTEGVASKTRS